MPALWSVLSTFLFILKAIKVFIKSKVNQVLHFHKGKQNLE